jgi:hypothetical protein
MIKNNNRKEQMPAGLKIDKETSLGKLVEYFPVSVIYYQNN